MSNRVPQLRQLQQMTAAEIGRAIIVQVKADLDDHGGSREAFWIARSLSEQTGNLPESSAVEPLLMEGLQSLIKDCLLVPAGNGQRYRLSRDGIKAATAGHPSSPEATSDLPLSLLHSRIISAALPDFEKGPERYDKAVFNAFREVEIIVRERSGLDTSSIDLMNAAFANQKGRALGPLLSKSMEPSEAVALRNLFAGAYGAFRNPPAHRVVGHDAVQTLRLLITASALIEIVEQLSKPD